MRISVCDRECPPGFEISTNRETEVIKMLDASRTVYKKPTSLSLHPVSF